MMCSPRLRHTLFAALLAVLVAGLAPTLVNAQEGADEPSIELSFRASPDPIRIGDHVTLSLVAEHDADVIITARPPRGAHMDLVTERLPETEPLPNGRERTVIEFVVQPFGLGELSLDDIRVDWLREDSATGSILLSGQSIDVVPLRAADDTALRPLREQLDVPGAPAAWLRPAGVAAGVIALVLVLAGAAYWTWSRMRPEAPVAAPDMTAEEQARANLETLTGLRLRSDADFEHFYGLLSITVRRYLQERFGFNATAFTTTELEERMVKLGLDRWQARLVSGLLQRADAAVYARQYPDPESADHDLTMAFEIIELSRPLVEQPEEETVGV